MERFPRTLLSCFEPLSLDPSRAVARISIADTSDRLARVGSKPRARSLCSVHCNSKYLTQRKPMKSSAGYCALLPGQ